MPHRIFSYDKALGSIYINLCTFADNYAAEGNPIYSIIDCLKLYDCGPSSFHIANSVVWDGQESMARMEGSSVIITHSDIPGEWSGYGNIDADPCFAAPGYWDSNDTPDDPNDDIWVHGDYHLKSKAGRWNPDSESWVIDDVSSPCIDGGDSAPAIGREPFPNGGIVNMGFYGGSAEAAKTYFGRELCDKIIAADINGDCSVDFRDMSLAFSHWLEDNTPPPAPLLPGRATNPDPCDGAIDIRANYYLILTWEAGHGATSHDVYFGVFSPGTFRSNYRETSFRSGYPELDYETTYYWRIDEVNEAGTTKGTVWSFTTEERGPNKGRACFPAETIVWVDGEMVEISEVAAGAMVDKAGVAPMITDLHKTVCAHQIEDVDVHDEFDSWDRYDIVFENGNRLAVADSHYFLVDSGKWACVQKLTAGSKLSTLGGSVTVKTIKKTKSSGTVYNLKIKNSDRYLVGKDGIIVRDW